jgi:hypothetical protein
MTDYRIDTRKSDGKVALALSRPETPIEMDARGFLSEQ